MSEPMPSAGGAEPVEPIEQIKASDWTDMDLLTRDMAGNLLDNEIDDESKALASIENDPGLDDGQREAALDLHNRRINAMREARDGLSAEPDSAATTPTEKI